MIINLVFVQKIKIEQMSIYKFQYFNILEPCPFAWKVSKYKNDYVYDLDLIKEREISLKDK